MTRFECELGFYYPASSVATFSGVSGTIHIAVRCIDVEAALKYALQGLDDHNITPEQVNRVTIIKDE